MWKSLRQQALQYHTDRQKALYGKKNGKEIYGVYFFTVRERVEYIGLTGIIVLFFAWFFYHSLLAVPFLIPVGVYLYLEIQKNLQIRQQKRLIGQFKDCILTVATNLKAGYSIENAFVESISDMTALYGSQSMIVRELRVIQRGLHNNSNLGVLLEDLAFRSENNDIKEFSAVFEIARRSGGNMTDIIAKTATLLEERIYVEQEIQLLIAGKRLECNIMNGIPFVIVGYMAIGSPGYFEPLYHSVTGALIMSGCLLLYGVAFMGTKYILKRL